MGTCCVFVLRMLFNNFCWRHKTVATSVSVIVRPSLWQNQKSIKVCNLWTAAELQRLNCSFGDFLTENRFLKTNYIDLLAGTFLYKFSCALILRTMPSLNKRVPDRNIHWQIITRPLSWRVPDHCADQSALEVMSQTVCMDDLSIYSIITKIFPKYVWQQIKQKHIWIKWPLIMPSPDWSDLWSCHPQTEVTSDNTILRPNQIPDHVILVWEHTVGVEFWLIRGNFWMAP